MRLQNVGIDGLYRYDIPPNQRRTQGMLHGVYMGELKKKENPHGGPIFTIHGLRNFSSIPLGDMRVNRTVSTLRESYLDPADRAFHAPRFDHVQDGEAVDNAQTPRRYSSENGGFIEIANHQVVQPRSHDAVVHCTRAARRDVRFVPAPAVDSPQHVGRRCGRQHRG